MKNAMLNEDTILEQQDDVSITGHEGNKCKLFGIGDPKFVVAKGAPKGKRQQTCHTQRTCPAMVGSKRPECFLLESQNHDTINNSNLAQDVLMRLQPYAYTEGELQQLKLHLYVICIGNLSYIVFSNM